MDTTAMETTWKRAGYQEVETRTAQPNVATQPHVHAFDARVLVVAGELTLTSEGQSHTYRAGETFEMAAGCLHSEQYGPEGATLLLGRKPHSSDV
jgi:quercetin dioxygenase-like cupin family protein